MPALSAERRDGDERHQREEEVRAAHAIEDTHGVEVDELQRRGDDHEVVLLAAKVDPGAHLVIQGLDHPSTMFAGRGNDDPDRAPGSVHHRLVVRRQLTAAVQHGQAHHRPGHLDVTHLLDLHQPA